MATAAQIAANQENAKHSTGPSEEGKAASCMNNFRHGLAGSLFFFTSDENPAHYDALLKALEKEHAPQTVTESLLVEKMGQAHWLAQRAIKYQTLCATDDTAFAMLDQTNKWARYQNTHERNFQRSLNQLLRLREQRTKEQIGFESLKQAEAKTQAAEANQQTRVAHDKLKTDILQYRAEREKSKAIVAGIKGAQAMEKHLGPDAAAAFAQMAA